MNEIFDMLQGYLPAEIMESIKHMPSEKLDTISEIRLRLQRSCSVSIGEKNEILINYQLGKPILLRENDMLLTFRKVCENSIYKYENEIKNGYITLPNGCRVGFCGTRNENGMIKDISSINIRIAHKVENAAEEIFDFIYYDKKVTSSLIVSEPCGGKTTILTDITKRLSEAKIRTAVVDERGEIAACYHGVPQKDVGKLTDVLDNYPKGEGMMIALRTLSPQVLICDEIGSQKDVEAMMQALNAGVPVIASAHAGDIYQLIKRPQLKYLIDNGAISRIFVLRGSHSPGKLKYMMSAEDIYEIIRNHPDGM